jgi:hypothetical protein
VEGAADGGLNEGEEARADEDEEGAEAGAGVGWFGVICCTSTHSYVVNQCFRYLNAFIYYSLVFSHACSLTAAMALTLASQSSGVPLSPAKQLHEAVDDFQRILTADQRTSLKNVKSIPDADAVLVFTAQLDSSQHRRGRSIYFVELSLS